MKRAKQAVAWGGLAVALTAVLAGCKSRQQAAPAAADEQAASEPAGTSESAGQADVTETPAPPAATVNTNHEFAKAGDYETKALSRIELPSGLVIEDLRLGTGVPCLPKAIVTFHYRAKVKDGSEFDSTAERPEGPAVQTAGLGTLMRGLKDGMVGMKQGGRRRLTIPPDLAFSWLGAKNPAGEVVVPPESTVVFVVDLIDIEQNLMLPGTEPTAPAPAAGQ